MVSEPISIALAACIVSTAVIGGVFFAFSSFVMPALARIAPAEGVRAMQSINIAAVHRVLMLPLFGTAVLTITVLVLRFGNMWVALGGATYLIGVLGVTLVANVPRNNLLAAVDTRTPNHDAVWRHYVAGWIRWNHIRTAAAVVSSAAHLAAYTT